MDANHDGGYTRHNADLATAQDRALTAIAADAAAGRMPPDAAQAEEAATRAFVRENFAFHQGDQEISRAELFR